MARMKQAPVEAPPESNSFVASAAQVNLKSNSPNHDPFMIRNRDTHWQEECWAAYESVGEFRFAADWVGSTLSKATLFATEMKNGKADPVKPGSEAAEIMAELFDGEDGQTEMLRLIGIHFTVAGECYIVSWEDKGLRHWRVVAAQAIKVGTKWLTLDDEKIEIAKDGALCIRLWKPHPRRHMEAMSPAKSALSILRELIKLTQLLDSQLESRLAGAGILLMPSEISLPKADMVDQNGEQLVHANSADELMFILQTVMATAIKSPGTASALVPIVITAPAEHIEKVQHMTFWSEMDKEAINLREEAIGRLSLSMDMPPEILTGVGDSNHWASFQADESSIKSHTEPLLRLINTSLAAGYLKPAMTDRDQAVLRLFSVGADTSEMRLRPNRSKEALEMYAAGALGEKALRRETGFDETDAMDTAEMATWLTRKVASGSATPEMVNAALAILGVVLPVTVDTETMRESRPSPSLEGHPVQGPPDREESEQRQQRKIDQAALIASSEQAVLRALERAGNRIKNKHGIRTANVKASALYMHATIQTSELGFLLDDAWGHVPSIAVRAGVEPDVLTASLDSYCRLILGQQTEHTFDKFAAYMKGNEDA